MYVVDGMEDVEHIRLARVQSRKADHAQPDRLFLAAATLRTESRVYNFVMSSRNYRKTLSVAAVTLMCSASHDVEEHDVFNNVKSAKVKESSLCILSFENEGKTFIAASFPRRQNILER